MSQAELQNIKNQANFLIEAGRGAEAITLLTQGLNIAPDDEELLCLLAQAAIGLERWRDARRYVERAIAVAPENDWAHRIHSIVLRNSFRRHEAVAAAKEAVRLDPMVPHNWHTLASAQLNIFDLKEARATAERLRELEPSWYLSHQMLALVALKEENNKAAEACCRRELELNPNSYHGLNNLGVALLNQKRKREAIDAFTRAAKLNPAAPIARDNIAAAVSKYLPRISIPVFGFWIILNGLRVAGQNGNGQLVAAIVGVIALAVGGFYLVRWYRYRSLPMEVRAYLRTRKSVPLKKNSLSSKQLWIAAIVICAVLFVGWLVILLIDWEMEGNFPGVTRLIFPALMVLALGGCVIAYRRTMAKLDEQSTD